ncbi:MAG: hypothetical protein MUP21_02375 [Dehalococcoidia bacterium]|nr:hypothetical protein [Dehalococcoidia bacterium]
MSKRKQEEAAKEISWHGMSKEERAVYHETHKEERAAYRKAFREANKKMSLLPKNGREWGLVGLHAALSTLRILGVQRVAKEVRKSIKEKDSKELRSAPMISEEERKRRKAAYDKAYREANKGKIAAKDKADREANPEKIAAQRKAYREANKENLAAQRKARREAKKKTKNA